MALKRILFVCTGNSCRSVMAEGLLRARLSRAGVGDVTVESAGVFAMEGMSPTRETLRVLQGAGVDVSDHQARAVTAQMAEAADLILVMEAFQVEEILRRFPSATGKVHLLKAYGLQGPEAAANPTIPDPIGKPMEVYEVCFNDIQEAVERVARSLGVRGTS